MLSGASPRVATPARATRHPAPTLTGSAIYWISAFRTIRRNGRMLLLSRRASLEREKTTRFDGCLVTVV